MDLITLYPNEKGILANAEIKTSAEVMTKGTPRSIQANRIVRTQSVIDSMTNGFSIRVERQMKREQQRRAKRQK